MNITNALPVSLAGPPNVPDFPPPHIIPPQAAQPQHIGHPPNSAPPMNITNAPPLHTVPHCLIAPTVHGAPPIFTIPLQSAPQNSTLPISNPILHTHVPPQCTPLQHSGPP